MNEKFLEVGDVMQILGISRSAAYKLIRIVQIPFWATVIRLYSLVGKRRPH